MTPRREPQTDANIELTSRETASIYTADKKSPAGFPLVLPLLLLFHAHPLRAQEAWPEVPSTNSVGRRLSRYSFTTKAYHDEAFRLILHEVNEVARNMKLETNLPLTSNNIAKAFISPYGFARFKRALGSISTTDFTYFVSQGCKLSYIDANNSPQHYLRYQASYTWPTNRIDRDEAYRQATNWLALASMDVKSLNHDCKYSVSIETSYIYSPPGKFVPVYLIEWRNGDGPLGVAASVVVFTPTRELLQLRVEDPKYILRPPITFTNLPALLSQPNIVPREH